MPCALRNAPVNGARTTAKKKYLDKAFTLLSLGKPRKQYLSPMAAISTSTVLPGMNQAIELSGTPACRSAKANPTKDAGISNGQTLTRTSNNPVTRIAHPGQSGHTVLGFEISSVASLGTRYDKAAITPTTSNVARESRCGWLCEMRLSAIVMTTPLASRNSIGTLAFQARAGLRGETSRHCYGIITLKTHPAGSMHYERGAAIEWIRQWG